MTLIIIGIIGVVFSMIGACLNVWGMFDGEADSQRVLARQALFGVLLAISFGLIAIGLVLALA